MALAMATSQLDAFVRGSAMIKDEDLKHLDPLEKEIWTIRSFLERPQIRLFGWFVQQRQFIVVHGKRRDHLDSQSKWDRAIEKVVKARSRLFPGVSPYSAFSFSDYI